MPRNRKMTKSKKIIYSLGLIPLIAILLVFAWFLSNIFEGERMIFVASALKGITDLLVEVSTNAREKKPQKVFNEFSDKDAIDVAESTRDFLSIGEDEDGE